MHKSIYLLAGVCIVLLACKKQTGQVESAALQEYYPLQTGKYIRYRLDSTRFIHFGQRDTVVSYDAKDIVEEETTDSQGQPAFRVVRYLRDLASTNESDYTPALTYLVSPKRESIEINENNLRFRKLQLPVTNGFNWKGNRQLPSAPFYELYGFSNDEDISFWEYSYQEVDQPAIMGDHAFPHTVTVLQVADSSNVPIEFPDGHAYRNYWVEQYAKEIGLIYKEIVMWEYQPPHSGNPGFRSGFGLRMTITGHN